MRYLLSWRLAWSKVYVKRTAVYLSFFNTNRSHTNYKNKMHSFPMSGYDLLHLNLPTIDLHATRKTCKSASFSAYCQECKRVYSRFEVLQPDKFGRDFFQSPQENYFKHPSIYGKSANKPCKHLPRSSSQHIYLRSARQCPFSYNFSGNFVNL